MLLMYCPKVSGNRDVMVCLYNCPKGTVMKCSEYNRRYDEFKDLQIEQKYIDKYGPAEFIVPMARRKRRKRRVVNG